MALDCAKSILDLEDRKKAVPFHVKAWGQDVYLRDPSAADRDEWEVYAHENRGKSVPWRAKLAQVLLCDENGERLFSSADVPKLAGKNAAALHEIWERGLELMTVTEEEVEAIEGESDATR
jgi:hypothetical protein